MAKIAKKVVGDTYVRFEFANGEFTQCDVSKLSSDIIHRLALHGLSQKVGDSYASAESVTDAQRNAEEVWRNLSNGIWATKATRGGKIVEALSRATGKPIDECLEAYAAMDDDARKALRVHPSIKAALASIEAERAAALAKAVPDDATDLNALF